MNTKGLARIRILMVTSHLLLSVFVAYWLAGRYRIEKDLLHDDLSRKFQEAHDNAVDSMLKKHVIDPMFIRQEGSWQNRDTLIFRGDDRRIQISLRDTFDRLVTETGNPPFTPGDTGRRVNVIYQSVVSGGNRERIMIQGVKILAGIAKESPGPEKDSLFTYLSSPDTGLIKQYFAQSLSDYGFTLQWSSIPISEPNSKKETAISFLSGIPGQGIAVGVMNYGVYLLRRMISNFAFALVLLTLTGAAFVISFRSLKKQILLTRMRNDFVGNITHELKTPVSTAKVAIEAIRRFGVKEDPVRTESYLDIVSQEMDRLEQLTGSVLASSVYEGTHSWISTQSIDIREVAREVLDALGDRLVTEGASMHLETEGINFTVRADRLHLRGALMNLADNSLKYGNSPVIWIRIDGRSRLPRLVFSDNGPGIPGEYLDKVFERFFRVPTGDVHNVKGYGLGLSYVKAVMEQHGGTVKVENNPKGGCSFILRFE